MKKVGIMSMQRVVNYGSFLQAYGLKSIIENLGYEVQFVDYEFEKSFKEINNNIMKKIVNNKNIIEAFKRKKHQRCFENKYKEYLKILDVNEEKNIRPDIDSLVIGSDEVFNCTQEYPVGYSRELFGKNYESKNVISYAGSFGYTKFEDLKKYEIDKEIGELLNEFKAISVRDNNSFEICKNITRREDIQMNLDPVLVFDLKKEITNNIDLKNFIIIYAYPKRMTKEENKYIKKFAKKYSKKIISLGFYQKIADYNIICNPFEVLEYFKKADFVITDTFHGTIFSAKMNTNFATIIRDSNRNKLTTLLEKLNLKNQLVNSCEDIEKLYNKSINFTKTNEIIKEESSRTINYLKYNL